VNAGSVAMETFRSELVLTVSHGSLTCLNTQRTHESFFFKEYYGVLYNECASSTYIISVFKVIFYLNKWRASMGWSILIWIVVTHYSQ